MQSSNTLTKSYPINKGISRPIEFRGLKGQYIYYLAIGCTIILLQFCVLYITGLSVYIDLAMTIILAVSLFMGVTRMSKRYGQHGLRKKMDLKKVPPAIRPGQHTGTRGSPARLTSPGPGACAPTLFSNHSICNSQDPKSNANVPGKAGPFSVRLFRGLK